MRVLLIGENSFQELVKTQLVNKNIITEQNAIGVSTIENAKAVILNKLVSDKRHLDMIIISNHVTDDAFSPFADWVRYSTLSYSQDNFKLNALPIILFGGDSADTDHLNPRLCDQLIPRQTDHRIPEQIDHHFSGAN